METNSKEAAWGETAGNLAGGIGGHLAGAAIGQALIPIPGVGAAIGGIGGSLIGSYLGGRAGGAAHAATQFKPQYTRPPITVNRPSFNNFSSFLSGAGRPVGQGFNMNFTPPSNFMTSGPKYASAEKRAYWAPVARQAAPAIAGGIKSVGKNLLGKVFSRGGAKAMGSAGMSTALPFAFGAAGTNYAANNKEHEFKQKLFFNNPEWADKYEMGTPQFMNALSEHYAPYAHAFGQYMMSPQNLGMAMQNSGLPWYAQMLLRPSNFNPQAGYQGYNQWLAAQQQRSPSVA